MKIFRLCVSNIAQGVTCTSESAAKPSKVTPVSIQMEPKPGSAGSKLEKVVDAAVKANFLNVQRKKGSANAKQANGSENSSNSSGPQSDAREDSNDFKFDNGSSLLGSEELDKYLENRRVKIQVTTWNMGSLPLPKEQELRKFFIHNQDESLTNIDIHVICIQECWPDVDSWELELQVCLGTGYALFHSLSFGTLHISVFLKRDLLWFTTEPTDWTISVRSGRLFKTKGSAGIYFGFFGSKFLFATAHLSAGEERERERTRVEELTKILTFYKKSIQQNQVDAIFFCGDLNFRISLLKREEILKCLRDDQIQKIIDMDQLFNLFRRKDSIPKCLEGFHEAATITFRPTYKYDIGTDKFDTSSKQRAPAYTDRIIYKTKSSINTSNDQPVVCLAYEAITSIRVSDHKPVFAVFSAVVKPGFDNLPLSGANFKKEIFIKAAHKRARYLLDRRKKLASTACSVA